MEGVDMWAFGAICFCETLTECSFRTKWCSMCSHSKHAVMRLEAFHGGGYVHRRSMIAGGTIRRQFKISILERIVWVFLAGDVCRLELHAILRTNVP